jgi:hypothetical protein
MALYLPNLCLLLGIACVTVVDAGTGSGFAEPAGHLLALQTREGQIKGNRKESKELDRLCLTAHDTRCLGGVVCYSFLLLLSSSRSALVEFYFCFLAFCIILWWLVLGWFGYCIGLVVRRWLAACEVT